ncbi:hypothetical protein THAOC_20563 [Thalassiosira oceanica]|uniref:Uncharacterized protein n=1 Tax=Thalassiosira oceanica TaxID=159749 RepID=K0RZL8_THAOC|nr:hypothetical protein THAOC_20563 [Thalassiosira oceanica]|eukprot:EJK59243.1 hypothetical protein THAOC_20563 [Thalassiosira oceanica]
MVRSCEQAYYGEGDERATCAQLSPLEALDDDSLFRIVSFADVKVSMSRTVFVESESSRHLFAFIVVSSRRTRHFEKAAESLRGGGISRRVGGGVLLEPPCGRRRAGSPRRERAARLLPSPPPAVGAVAQACRAAEERPREAVRGIPAEQAFQLRADPAAEHVAHEELGDGLDGTAEGDQFDDGRNDPPPCEFSCDSFALTSPSVGAEFVLLDPFSGSIVVYDSLLANALGSEEVMLEQAMIDASESIIAKRDVHDETQTSTSRISNKMYDTRPRQTLFSVKHYFDLDLNEYFGVHTPFVNKSEHRDGNVTVDWVGVDSHIGLREDARTISNTMIGAARILTMEFDRRRNVADLECTEIFAWSDESRDDAGYRYGQKLVCRAAGSFYYLDVCVRRRCLFASFQVNSCPFDNDETFEQSRGDHDVDEMDDHVNENGSPIRHSTRIHCLPLVEFHEGTQATPEKIASYFPSPLQTIKAQYPVVSFSVDSIGRTLLVGTSVGTVEVWSIGEADRLSPRRMQVISVNETFMKRARSITMAERPASLAEHLDGKLVEETDAQDDLALIEVAGESELCPHKCPTSKISHLILPKHLSPQQCGFLTKQRNTNSGTTLLLWQTRSLTSDKATDASNHFALSGMINLPLSIQCHPEIHFDGRRIIVFGKDHIGLIFLVYHVLSSRFDQDEFDEQIPSFSRKSKKRAKGDQSAGIVQLGDCECRIKFANRIRHVGLGGLEYFDSLLMSCNERFIVVNTKTGNLIAQDRNACEGLLVIDLLEHGC